MPKHLNGEFLLPHKDAVTARKEAPDRSVFNDWVWDRLLDRRKVDRKLRKGFHFHHEIASDGALL